jgi:hypothetical protein
LFGLTWYVLPPARWEGFGVYMIMPVLTLSAIYMAYIARLTRSGMLEVLRSNYIRTARAKGLPERQILWRHAMRGGLLPVVSFSGPALALLLTGTCRRRAHLRAAGSRQLLHQREPEPRRAAHHRHRRVHLDRRADIQFAGGHCVRIHRPESEVLADLKVGTTTANGRSARPLGEPNNGRACRRHIALEGCVEAPQAQQARRAGHGRGEPLSSSPRRSGLPSFAA